MHQHSLLFAVLGFAIWADGTWGTGTGIGIRCTATFASLLTLRFGAISITIRVIAAITILTVHEAVKLRSEAEVILKCIGAVKVIEVVRDVMGLLELLHDLVVFRIDFLIITIVNTLGLLFALEDIEERLARN